MTVTRILKSKGSRDVVTIAPGKTVSDAAAILSERKIGSLVVSEDGTRASGILSERDIVREIGRRGAACLLEPVEALMTRRLVTCQMSETADAVLAKMTDGRFRHMPVVDEADNMVGLVTLGDVVKYRLSEVTAENQALEGMIMGY